MYQKVEKTLLFFSDFISINLAFFFWAWLRKEFGFFAESNFFVLSQLSLIIFIYWFFLFLFFGLYRTWYAQSRIDEMINIFKTVSVGVLLIFLITFDLERDLSSPPTISRMFIVNYWLLLLLFITSTRLVFRTFQRFLLSAGLGARRTLIIGWGEKSWRLFDEIQKYPALGYQVVGFVSEQNSMNINSKYYKQVPLLGTIERVKNIIQENQVQEVIFSLEGNSKNRVLELVDQCNGFPVNFKIIPDLYDIVVGQVRTNQIYGFPLIDILPQYMPLWEQRMKRLMDVTISLFILLTFSPIWLLIALAIKLDSKGPIFYKQQRVGKNGNIFTIYKFRSMIHNAESVTGPRWAEPDDPRITRVGKIIRKLHLDEIPQFINVLKGEMSLIGPRPERPYFVEKFKNIIPFYTCRLRVQPGITGWAQIKGKYDDSIENVKTKLQYDLFYLENMSLRMDLKILLNTIYVMLTGKGQ